MRKHLPKIQLINRRKLMRVAAKHHRRANDRIAKNGIDAHGNQLPEYTEAYLKLLQKDFRKKDGSRYKSYGGSSLETGGSKQSKRNFRLRGRTMLNFAVRKVTNKFYQIGWDGEAAAIVEGNAEKGRDIYTTIPNDEFNFVVKELGLEIDKELNRLKNETITINL